LVLAGGDLGTVIIMGMIVIAALFFAGVSLRVLLIPVAAGAAAIGVMAVTSPNRMARIFSFLSENCTDYTNACWQPLHGKWALAGGGIFGVGPGNSKAKWSWLPAADNDYIFAIIGEELGLIGAVVVLLLFVLMAVAFVRIIKETSDSMVRITTGAVMIWIVGQAFVNIGVVVGVLPVLGVPLPLLSSGGTALIASLLAIGVVLSFTRSTSSPQVPFSTVRSVRPVPSRTLR
jgi:cell division protein FtsW